MVCPVQEHSKNYSAKATILAGVLNMWRRHYGEVLFGSMMVKHIVELYNDIGNGA